MNPALLLATNTRWALPLSGFAKTCFEIVGGPYLMPSTIRTAWAVLCRSVNLDVQPDDGHKTCFVTSPALGKQDIFVYLGHNIKRGVLGR